jgi:DNA repair photolyase
MKKFAEKWSHERHLQKKRLQTVEALAKAGIPVMVNIAPIIPGLNDTEIFSIAKAAAEHGALKRLTILL